MPFPTMNDEEAIERETALQVSASDRLLSLLKHYHPGHDVAGIDDVATPTTKGRRVWPAHLK